MLAGIALSTTEDLFLGGAVRLRQPAKGYRAGSDAVLLAAVTPVRPHQTVLELGTGYGQIALCLLARIAPLQVIGVELMAQPAALARYNAELNGFSEQFKIVEADLQEFTPAALVDVVVANPPYRQAAHHTASADPIKAAATVERTSLNAWCAAAARALKPEGVFMMIHDARREADIITALTQAGLARIDILPLLPKASGEVNRVIVKAQKLATAAVTRHAPLLLHAENGNWCAQVDAALRMPLYLKTSLF